MEYKLRYKRLKERKSFKDHKTKNPEKIFNKKVVAPWSRGNKNYQKNNGLFTVQVRILLQIPHKLNMQVRA